MSEPVDVTYLMAPGISPEQCIAFFEQNLAADLKSVTDGNMSAEDAAAGFLNRLLGDAETQAQVPEQIRILAIDASRRYGQILAAYIQVQEEIKNRAQPMTEIEIFQAVSQIIPPPPRQMIMQFLTMEGIPEEVADSIKKLMESSSAMLA